MAIDLGSKKEAALKPKRNLSKTITPRNEVCTILGVKFRKNDYNNQNGLDVLLNLVGEDLTDQGFEGFFIDKDNPALGRHNGPVGDVKLSMWSYVTKTFPPRNGKEGKTIERDQSIIEDLGKVASLCNKVDEFFQGSFDDAIGIIEHANDVFKGCKLNFLIAGKEYMSNGYTKYDLFLPKTDTGYFAMEVPGTEPSLVQKFDPSIHIIRKKAVATVTEFAPVDATLVGLDEFAPIEEEFDVQM